MWDGNLLRSEGSVIAAFQEDKKVGYCWPYIEDAVL
jgi:hypothetical protein